MVNSNLCLLEPSNLTILSSRFWIKDVVKLSNNFLVLDLGYKVKTLLWWYFSEILSLVGIDIVPFLCIIPVTGSTKSLSLSISLGLEKCSVWVFLNVFHRIFIKSATAIKIFF